MCSEFEFSVEIRDQKYEISLQESESNVQFGDIYPKIQEIVKIGLNEDIGSDSHQFEVCLQFFIFYMIWSERNFDRYLNSDQSMDR